MQRLKEESSPEVSPSDTDEHYAPPCNQPGEYSLKQAILQGTLGGIFFAFLGLNSPVLWGVLMGILAFIPILGIGLVLLPAAVVLLSIFGGMSLFGVLGIVYGPLIVSLFLTLSEKYRNEYSQIKENRKISDNQRYEEGLYARYPRQTPLAKETF